MDRRAFLRRLGQIGLAAPIVIATPKLLVPNSSASLHDANLAARLKRALAERMAADPTLIPCIPADPADWAAYLAELERSRPYTGYHQNEIGMAGVILRQLRIEPEQVAVHRCLQTDRVAPGSWSTLPANEREYELNFKVLAPIRTDMAWLNGRELFPAPAVSPRGLPVRSESWGRRTPEPMNFSPLSTITLKYRIRHDFEVM